MITRERKFYVLCQVHQYSFDRCEEGMFDTREEAIAARHKTGYFHIHRTICAKIGGAWMPITTF